MTFQQSPHLRPLPERSAELEQNLAWSLEVWGERIPGYDHAGWRAFYQRALKASYDRYQPGAELVWVIEMEGRCVGSIALVGEDDLEDFTECTPWMAAFIIDPALRHQGLGRKVVAIFEEKVKALGVGHLYLWTDTYADWYSTQGYRTIGNSRIGQIDAVVMEKSL